MFESIARNLINNKDSFLATLKHQLAQNSNEIDWERDRYEEYKESEDFQKIINLSNALIPVWEQLREFLDKDNKIELKNKISEFANDIKNTKINLTKNAMIRNPSEVFSNSFQNTTKSDSKEVSIIIADSIGIIHSFNKITPKMFHVNKEALRGKNYFQLISSYSRKFLYETFGNNMFKTFKETSRTIRYSLPHMDDVDFEHFYVITSKISLVTSKVASPLKTDPFMIKIWSRVSSKTSKLSLFNSYVNARKHLRNMNNAPATFARENVLIPSGSYPQYICDRVTPYEQNNPSQFYYQQ